MGQKGSFDVDTTLLVSLSQQLAAYRSMDVIANNLANVSTPAFKREQLKFEEYGAQSQDSAGDQGEPVSFVLDRGVVRDAREGRLEHTGNPLDLAIDGNGYFVVQTDNGPRYTRDGHFTLDSEGRIVTEDGNRLQGEGGDITITHDDGEIHIANDGTVSGINGQLGKLRIVTFADENALSEEGANLYTTDQPAQTATGKVEQGMIESSNVEPVIEITNMIQVMRAYQASTNLTEANDNLVRQAIEKLGAVQTS